MFELFKQQEFWCCYAVHLPPRCAASPAGLMFATRLLVVAAVAATVRGQCDANNGCLCQDDHAGRFTNDGECDDGGPDSDSGYCALGSDCTDCSERRDGQQGSFICKDLCGVNTRDGVCDDGGPGALPSCIQHDSVQCLALPLTSLRAAIALRFKVPPLQPGPRLRGLRDAPHSGRLRGRQRRDVPRRLLLCF